MKIGTIEFRDRTYVMAIINLTPDSFYAPSRKTRDDVLKAAERAIADGAAVLDIGAQSTRPGYKEISAAEETERFYSSLLDIKRNFGVPVSVDTYFAESAQAALEGGADMINDIWGLTHDEKMASVIAERGAAVCIMHNSVTPIRDPIWQPIMGFLRASVQRALAAGISGDRICVDGGIGFAKSKEQNFELLNGYERLLSLGYPTLLGCSRKSMFGGKPEDRLPMTLAATLTACKKGALFVRVHDVAENARVIREYYGRNGGTDG